MRRSAACLFVLFLLFTAGLSAQPTSTPSVPRFGIGVFGNVGYGSAGFTSVPGATFLFGDFPVKAHLGWAEGVVEGGLTADWLLLNTPIAGTPYSWYVGPGLYAAAGSDFGSFSVAGFGARGVAGARIVFFDAWETYLAWTPSYGLAWYNGAWNGHGSVDLEAGLRYLFPAGTTEIAVAEAPHPEVSLTPSLAAFSPGTSGGASVQKLTVSPVFLDRVASWTFTIVDEAGTVVATQSGTGAPASALTWDGRTGGQVAPEANYSARLEVTWTDKTTASVTSKPFAIDMSVPEVTAQRLGTRFSPNGDGTNDQLVLKTSSKAKTALAGWAFTVSDAAGVQVHSQKGEGTLPETLIWDGATGPGTQALAGKDYTWAVAVTDQTGKAQAVQGVVGVDFVHPTLTVEAAAAAFSPLGDPNRLALRIGPDRIDAVTGWKLAVVDEKGGVFKEFAAKGPVPSSITWDGKSNLSLLTEGTYKAVLTVNYTFDDGGTAESAPFRIDLTPPALKVALEARHFLPDGDGKDEVQIFALQSASRAEPAAWSLTVKQNDQAFRTWKGTGQPPARLPFDGKGDDGTTPIALGADAAWAFTVTDALGLSSNATGALPVDLPRAPVTLTGPAAFSPSGSPALWTGTADPAPDRLASWTLTVETQPAEGPAAAAWQKTGKGPLTALTWDGKNTAGKVTEGTYRARLDLVYDRGEESSATSAPFLLDNTAPALTALRADQAWSPDGDGQNDDLGLTVAVKNLSPVAEWTFTVTDPVGTPFSSTTQKGPLPELIPWDGKSTTGELVASEQTYAWTLNVTDTLAKKATAKGTVATDILVLKTGGGLKLDLGGLTFVPNKADLIKDGSPAAQKNTALLDKLKSVLSRLSQYKITVVGHAVNVSGTAKEEKELQVLSTARANAVKDTLVKLGLDAGRITAVGKGGTDQVVSDTDTVNRWKNRRVEFLLSE